jgi:3-hydroxyisobutyrate dehydrogenase-like beta-hydroxyacid dehydrogenase
MGTGLGWDLRNGGARVVTTVAGRSPRTRRFVADAGVETLPSLDDVVREAQVILVVTPPSAALGAAEAIAEAATRTGASPLVADLNAIAPSTVDKLVRVVEPLEFVDGSISGAPPTVRPGLRLYLSGPAARTVAELPWQVVNPIVLAGPAGRASALKMCTASVYKGFIAVCAQALRTAYTHGLLDEVLEDLIRGGYDKDTPVSVALAATKAHRYIPEMLEIAATQRGAGLPGELFEAFATVYAELGRTPLAGGDPESVDLAQSAEAVIKQAFQRS